MCRELSMDSSSSYSSCDGLDSSSRAILGSKSIYSLQSLTVYDKIMTKRKVFRFLPVYCSNDLVHGSWWYVWGSVIATIVAIVPVIDSYLNFFNETDDTLAVFEFNLTWGLLICSGVFFTLGSLAFVRAFEEPKLPPLFSCRHLATDKLLGAWLFLLGTIPSVPYAVVFFLLYPSELVYLCALVASVVFVLASYFFVLACYPNENNIDVRTEKVKMNI